LWVFKIEAISSFVSVFGFVHTSPEPLFAPLQKTSAESRRRALMAIIFLQVSVENSHKKFRRRRNLDVSFLSDSLAICRFEVSQE